MTKRVRNLIIVTLIFIITSVAACNREETMDCKHQAMQQIREEIFIGFPRNEVEEFLKTIGIDFSYHDKNELILTKDKDANKFSSKIIAIDNIPRKATQLITNSELIVIGFDEHGLVKDVSCETIYTGL